MLGHCWGHRPANTKHLYNIVYNVGPTSKTLGRRCTMLFKCFAFAGYQFQISLPNVHRALCCLFRPDTDGTRVSKCGQLPQQTRRLDPMLFQCWSSAVGGGPILKQHWVNCSRLLGSTQGSVYTHPPATIIFSPADQGTFSKTAGQSQAYYNT